MAIKFTKDQENAINATGTVLVSAAAGSGKTAVLTQRVIKRVCDPNDPATIDRMLIVTFTNASALEMRVRIGKELDRMCADNPGNSYILKQKLLLKNAKICTIDSFCIDLVKKHFGILGVSPSFSVAAPAQTAALRDRAMTDVLSRHFANPDEDFNQLCESFGIYGGDKKLQNAITSVYDFSLCMSRPEHWLETAVNNYFAENISACPFAEVILRRAEIKLKNAVDSINFILRESVGTEFEAGWNVNFAETLDTINEMLSAVTSKKWDRLYDLSLTFEKTKIDRIKKGQNKELHERMKEIRESVYKTVTSISDDMGGNAEQLLNSLKCVGNQVKTLVSLVREFSNAYFNLLNTHNILTFSLIEQLALKLLCTESDGELKPSELSKDICKLYDEVLVDEYQDNNDLQDSLFFAVSDSGKHLFMVGDVKQCIYAFRNANPDNFLRHKNAYPLYDGNTSPSKVVLSANFRSRKGVCDFVNGICSALMQTSTCGMDYDDEEKLVCGAVYPENDAPAAEIFITDSSDAEKNTADAETVADYIVKTMEEKPFLRDNDQLRKARYGDFAILLRSPKKRVKLYTDALKKRGIPVSYSSGEFYESPEILTAMSILRVIDNPMQDIPLLAAMSSAVFGFSFDEIAKLKSEYEGRNLYARVINAAGNGSLKCRQMLDTLANLRALAVTLPVGRLINEVYNVTFLKEIMSSDENGNVRKNNLLALVSMADEYESRSDGGLSGFIDYFERSAAEGSAGDKAPQSDVDAVRIMSFHGSKGLQFPICIIAAAGSGFNKTDLNDALIVNGKYGIGMSYVSDGVKYDTAARKALRLTQSQKLIAEEIRLFYVAMTRAEERLMISVTTNDWKKDISDAAVALSLSAASDGKVPAETVLSSLGLKKMLLCAALLQASGDYIGTAAEIAPVGFNGTGNFKFTLSHAVQDEEYDTEKREREVNNYVCDSETAGFLRDRFGYKYPFESSCNIPSKIAVTELVHGDKEQFAFKARPRFMSKAGLTPAERGTALHKFMQYADYSAAESNLQEEMERLYEWEFISREELEAIDKTALQRFFKSDIYRRIKQSPKVMREYKFMVKHPYADDETIVQGIADCIFFENKSAVILDFKTDNVQDINVLVERYSAQLEIYKAAISEIFEMPVSECVIYSMHLGEQINV